MMLRIADELAKLDHAQGIITGDSLGQVASQTLQNMVTVGDAVRMPVFRPLAGDDKLEILAIARKIRTYDISAEPFHDCCPMFLPRTPALHASAEELNRAEIQLDVPGLVRRGLETAATERYYFANGHAERMETVKSARV
jgi:thiamine biosynthesis protein ThiI